MFSVTETNNLTFEKQLVKCKVLENFWEPKLQLSRNILDVIKKG